MTVKVASLTSPATKVMQAAVLAILAVALSTRAAYAQTQAEKKVAETPTEIANEIVRSAYAIEKARDAATESFASSFERSFSAGMAQKPNGTLILSQNADATTAGMAAVRSEFRSQYDSYIAPKVTRAIAEIYEREFDFKELMALRSYYVTPQAKAFLASFRLNPNGLTTLDPVVAQFRNSRVGRKEVGLNQKIATVLMNVNLEATREAAPAVNNKFEAAIERAIAARKRPK